MTDHRVGTMNRPSAAIRTATPTAWPATTCQGRSLPSAREARERRSGRPDRPRCGREHHDRAGIMTSRCVIAAEGTLHRPPAWTPGGDDSHSSREVPSAAGVPGAAAEQRRLLWLLRVVVPRRREPAEGLSTMAHAGLDTMWTGQPGHSRSGTGSSPPAHLSSPTRVRPNRRHHTGWCLRLWRPICAPNP